MCWPCEAVQSREAPADEVVRGYITMAVSVSLLYRVIAEQEGQMAVSFDDSFKK